MSGANPVTSVIIITVLMVGLVSSAMGQNGSQAGASRRATSRVATNYPELAQRMGLQGMVKLEAGVRPNGSVKSARVIGGNPVLGEAASTAVGKWK
jgi:outer membrane biosynthesis protein TonB